MYVLRPSQGNTILRDTKIQSTTMINNSPVQNVTSNLRTFLSTFLTDEFLVHMNSLYVIVQVPYNVKFCVTELTVYDTLSVMILMEA
jgi:hypothetical protein